MTLDEQIIALGTLDGYTDIHGGENGGLYWRGRKDPRGMCEPLPDYDSLDVMHRMEKHIPHGQRKLYEDCLHLYGTGVFSEAYERREALLRILNLWKAPQ